MRYQIVHLRFLTVFAIHYLCHVFSAPVKCLSTSSSVVRKKKSVDRLRCLSIFKLSATRKESP